MYIVSACLIGVNCKYDNGNNENESVINFLKDKKFIPVCPEQLGGLTTPRDPAEITGDKIIDIKGIDVTYNFKKGAEETLKIARACNCKIAILKEQSPSCGVKKIYDGSFSGRIISGEGVTSRILKENGIEVMSEYEID